MVGQDTKYKDRSYVMKEWLKEPENGPHSYMTKTLEEAYYIVEGLQLREKYKYETKLKYW